MGAGSHPPGPFHRFTTTTPEHTMSEDDEFPYVWKVSEKQKAKADQAAALLEIDGNGAALSKGLKLVFAHAKAHAIGKTQIAFCTPEVKALIDNNQKFIEALCEEGVVEWLTPFVLGKAKDASPINPGP
jgi:hypothetical protein